MTTSGYPSPGDRIGAYLIQRRIGMGGMGMVFAATHEGLDRDVALKVIAPHLADDESFRARFTREARGPSRSWTPLMSCTSTTTGSTTVTSTSPPS